MVTDNRKLKKYLKKEWFDLMHMWCNSHRNFFHYIMDTTNISESWFKLSCYHISQHSTSHSLTAVVNLFFVNSSLKHTLSLAANKLISIVFTNIVDQKLYPASKAARLKARKQSAANKKSHESLYADLDPL